MPRLPRAPRRLAARGLYATAAAVVIGLAVECPAIEMFTYFGDGSRIGLPSLEVPVEAYPGIPLRSDRLRARRAARRQVAPAATAQGPGGITIRHMPPLAAPAPIPRMQPTSRRAAPATELPVAPSPEDILPEDVRSGNVRPPLTE